MYLNSAKYSNRIYTEQLITYIAKEDKISS